MMILPSQSKPAVSTAETPASFPSLSSAFSASSFAHAAAKISLVAGTVWAQPSWAKGYGITDFSSDAMPLVDGMLQMGCLGSMALGGLALTVGAINYVRRRGSVVVSSSQEPALPVESAAKESALQQRPALQPPKPAQPAAVSQGGSEWAQRVRESRVAQSFPRVASLLPEGQGPDQERNRQLLKTLTQGANPSVTQNRWDHLQRQVVTVENSKQKGEMSLERRIAYGLYQAAGQMRVEGMASPHLDPKKPEVILTGGTHQVRRIVSHHKCRFIYEASIGSFSRIGSAPANSSGFFHVVDSSGRLAVGLVEGKGGVISAKNMATAIQKAAVYEMAKGRSASDALAVAHQEVLERFIERPAVAGVLELQSGQGSGVFTTIGDIQGIMFRDGKVIKVTKKDAGSARLGQSLDDALHLRNFIGSHDQSDRKRRLARLRGQPVTNLPGNVYLLYTSGVGLVLTPRMMASAFSAYKDNPQGYLDHLLGLVKTSWKEHFKDSGRVQSGSRVASSGDLSIQMVINA